MPYDIKIEDGAVYYRENPEGMWLELDIQKLFAEIHHLEVQLAREQAIVSDLRDEIDMMEQNVDDDKLYIEDLHSEISFLEDEIDKKENIITELEQEIKELEAYAREH